MLSFTSNFMSFKRVLGMRLSADRLRILRERVLLFDGFSDEDILALLDYSDRRGLVDGEVVVDEGEESHSMFILISGHAVVLREHHDGTEVLAQLEPGATLGEMAMLDIAPRSARVVAKGMVLRSSFTRLFSSVPRIIFVRSYTETYQ